MAMPLAEREFAKAVEAAGFSVLRSGWPDFIVTTKHGTALAFVEIKDGANWLSPAQIAVHEALRTAGIEVHTLLPEMFPAFLYGLSNPSRRRPYRPRGSSGPRRKEEPPITMADLDAAMMKLSDPNVRPDPCA